MSFAKQKTTKQKKKPVDSTTRTGTSQTKNSKALKTLQVSTKKPLKHPVEAI